VNENILGEDEIVFSRILGLCNEKKDDPAPLEAAFNVLTF